jgi:hypothetical protein
MALSAYAMDEKYGFSKVDFQWAAAKVEKDIFTIMQICQLYFYYCFYELKQFDFLMCPGMWS